MDISAIGNWNQGAAAEFPISNQPNQINLPAIGMSWQNIRVGCSLLSNLHFFQQYAYGY